jgi:PAS domain S-box-containing protein
MCEVLDLAVGKPPITDLGLPSTRLTANPLPDVQDQGVSAFLDAAPDAIIVVDEQGRITRTNRLAETMFGYEAGELLGEAVEMLVPQRFRRTHLGDRERYGAEPRTRPMAAGRPLMGLRRDGTEFPVEISLSPMRTAAGTHVISIVRDITDRIKAELKFRGFIESAPDAVVIVDARGRISVVNHLTEKMFGYRRDELLDQPIELLVPERYRAEHVHERDAYLRAPRTRPMGLGRELLGRRKDGSEFPVEISLSPLDTEQGLLVTSIIRDMTQITASLREKEALLKEIHHRVKNNLQVISSLLRLQERNIADEATRELFAESQRRIQSMALVHEKLYSSGDLARIDFADYARSLATLLFRSFGVTDAVALRIESAEPVFLNVDTAVPCGLIVNELVTNSLKHAFRSAGVPPAGPPPSRRRDAAAPAGEDAGAPEIAISVRREPQRIVLRISDNGRGADVDAIAQSESLGLRLVRTLVRQLNAELSITSEHGLAFTIVMPGNG